MERVHLLIVDGQHDFCHPRGSLYVPGAEEDCRRVGEMIRRLLHVWNGIYTTYDSHNYVHIASPVFWRDSRGRHPEAYTVLVPNQNGNGIVSARPDLTPSDHEFWPARQSLYQRSLNYVKKLQENKRYNLCIWPPHCLLGTVGWTLMPQLMTPLLEWEHCFNIVEKIIKGRSLFTEHYSAFQAAVPDPDDTTTQFNRAFVNSLLNAHIVAVCGWTSSHCLKFTIEDLVCSDDDSIFSKLVLLTDGMSPVPGFERQAESFLKSLTEERRLAGKEPVKLATCKEFLS